MALYAIDSEFMDDGKTIELISLALVADHGGELYIQNRNANLSEANEWVKERVIPQLDHRDCRTSARKRDIGRGVAHCRKSRCPWVWHSEMANYIRVFVGDDPFPRFVGYYCAYDWVALCQLYGPMVNLPHGWPMYAIDLRQWLDEHGLQNVTQPEAYAHHALLDAQWVMQTYKQYVLGR